MYIYIYITICYINICDINIIGRNCPRTKCFLFIILSSFRQTAHPPTHPPTHPSTQPNGRSARPPPPSVFNRIVNSLPQRPLLQCFETWDVNNFSPRFVVLTSSAICVIQTSRSEMI